MIIMKAPDYELQKAVAEDSERLHKEAEDALKANKKEAEEIEKYHGKDTKKSVSNKQLKAMHLSEALFEDLNEEETRNFTEDVYDSIVKLCELYTYDGLTESDVRNAVQYFLDNFTKDTEIGYYINWDNEEPKDVPGFEGTWGKLNDLADLGESLNEELSQQGQKVLDELKKELGPELQKKVAFVIKDYAKENKPSNNKPAEKEQKDNLKEDVSTPERYSDKTAPEDRKYWYFTTHGVGPGTIPKDLTVLDIIEGPNDKGTQGDFVCLDGVLNTSELKRYDMRELPPSKELLASHK